MAYYTRIVGTGVQLAEKIVTNADLEKIVDTTDEWIKTRTGIEMRRIADPKKGETTVGLSHLAAEKALKAAGIAAEDLDMIVVGTVTPDTLMPNCANQVQARLGNKRAFTFDLQAACSGFIFGLSVADQYIRTGMVKNALVIGAETLSTITDWSDRSTCVLFGDAAGAAVVTRSEDPRHGILSTKIQTDGTYGELLQIPHGYSKIGPFHPEYNYHLSKIQMRGAEIFKLAVRYMEDTALNLLKQNGMTTKDVDFFIFHQANKRIIDYCAKALDVPPEKTWNNVHKYGNVSAATLPLCLDEAWKAGAVKPGDTVLMATFGGGLTWGGALVRL